MRILTLLCGLALGTKMSIMPQEGSIVPTPTPEDLDAGKEAAWNKFHHDIGEAIVEAAERGLDVSTIQNSLSNLGELANDEQMFGDANEFVTTLKEVTNTYEYDASALPPRTPWQAGDVGQVGDEQQNNAGTAEDIDAENEQQERQQQQ